jgi:hypothetical protein
MSERLMCKGCTCDRPKLALTEDPHRPPGRPNYAYVRALRTMLSAAERDWRQRTGSTLKRVAHPPYFRHMEK